MSPGVQRRQPSPNGDTHLCLVLRHANVLFLIHSRLQISHLTVEVDERTLQDVSMLQEGSDSALKFTVMKFKHAAIVLSAGHRSSTLKDHLPAIAMSNRSPLLFVLTSAMCRGRKIVRGVHSTATLLPLLLS